jgi:hypothetical protein
MFDLARFGMSTEDVGKKLIEAAQQQEQKRTIEAATADVAALISGIDEQKRLIAKHTKRQELFVARLEAINKGEFTVRADGLIVYNDVDLMREW